MPGLRPADSRTCFNMRIAFADVIDSGLFAGDFEPGAMMPGAGENWSVMLPDGWQHRACFALYRMKAKHVEQPGSARRMVGGR